MTGIAAAIMASQFFIEHCLQTASLRFLSWRVISLLAFPVALWKRRLTQSVVSLCGEHDVLFGGRTIMVGVTAACCAPAASITASVSFVNTRCTQQLSSYFAQVRKPLSFFFSATVTDESFGVIFTRFPTGLVDSCTGNSGQRTLHVLVGAANALGAVAGDACRYHGNCFVCDDFYLYLPACVARHNRITAAVVAVSMLSVCLFKIVGLEGPAILFGACLGVAFGRAKEGAHDRIELLLVYGICIATMLICRCVPLFALKGRELPADVRMRLELIPPAAFAALVANDLFKPSMFDAA